MLTMAPRLYGSLFGGAPKPEPVVPMPDPDSPEARAAKLKQMQEMLSRKGSRATTLLSGGGALG